MAIVRATVRPLAQAAPVCAWLKYSPQKYNPCFSFSSARINSAIALGRPVLNMTNSSITRKLAAIMFTDIVGFTNISAKDENKALALLDKQEEILYPINRFGKTV